jgi:TrkA-N domain
VIAALSMSIFVLVSRLLSVFPVLYALGNGLRASLIPSINLAQMSEFSLVIASLGLALNHISPQLVGVLTFVFAITSVVSTYLIAYNHEVQVWLSRLLRQVGFTMVEDAASKVTEEETESSIVFLGCFREGSSILYEMESRLSETNGDRVIDQILVIDFNPVVLRELNRRGIKCIYGDVANMDTLQHAGVQSAKIVVCTISDAILRGTTNLRLLRQARRLCPGAQIVVAADTIASAVELYEQGGDFVYIARLHSAGHMADLIARAMRDEYGFRQFREDELRLLKERQEVLQ